MTNKVLESLLREALREQSRREENPCPTLGELTRFVQRRLSSADRQRVDAHLEECHRCIADVARLYRGLKAVTPPTPSWWAAWLQSLSERWQNAAERKPFRVSVAVATAAVLIFALIHSPSPTAAETSSPTYQTASLSWMR